MVCDSKKQSKDVILTGMSDSVDSEIQVTQQTTPEALKPNHFAVERQYDPQSVNTVDSSEHQRSLKGETTSQPEENQEQEIITLDQLREMKRNIYVSKRLDPDGVSRLTAIAESYLSTLQNALKQDELYVEALGVLDTIEWASHTTGGEALNNMSNKFVEQNLDVMVQAATKECKEKVDTDVARVNTIGTLASVVSVGTDEQKELILKTMDSNISEWVSQPNDFRVFKTYIEVIFREGSVEQIENAANLAVSIYKNVEPSKQNVGLDLMRCYFEQFSANPQPQLYIMESDDPVYEQVKESLRKYIPDMDDFLAKAVDSGTNESGYRFGALENVGTRLVDNLKTVLDIERERPGICQVLKKEFGIRNFFRYPPEILIAQYDSRNKNTKKGVIVAALADHNGVFSEKSHRDAIADFYKQLTDSESLGEDYGVLAYEVDDTRELVRAIANARKRSKDGKLSFGILVGHGSETTVELGSFLGTKPERDKILTDAAIHTPIGYAVAESFEKGAPILFDSCSTGNGIVQETSKLGLRVSGPLRDASLLSYSVSMEEGHLNIEGNWDSDKATYKDGVRI